MKTSKPWYTSLTVWFALLGIAFSALQQLGVIFPDGNAHKYIEGAMALITLVLRFKTQLPITTASTPSS